MDLFLFISESPFHFMKSVNSMGLVEFPTASCPGKIVALSLFTREPTLIHAGRCLCC